MLSSSPVFNVFDLFIFKLLLLCMTKAANLAKIYTNLFDTNLFQIYMSYIFIL